MLHPIKVGEETHYAISKDKVWIPGVYATEQAAKYASRFPDAELAKLQEQVNEREPDYDKRVITLEMLQALAKRLKQEAPGDSE